MEEMTRKLKFLYRKARIKTLFGASSIFFYFKKNRSDIEINFKHGVTLNLFLFQKQDFSLDGYVAKIESDNVRKTSMHNSSSSSITNANA